MAEIFNLRLARKRKHRAEARAIAETNRVQHGRSKTEKQIVEAERQAAERHLDGHRRDVPDRK